MSVFRRLKKALLGPGVKRVLAFQHARLGTLTLDEHNWTAVIQHIGSELSFRIGGTDVPDPGLLRHAVDIIDDLDSFQRRTHAFLIEEAGRHPRAAEEIVQLKLDEVCLFWPHRPDDGMLYFSGPDDFRVWRCDYIDRQPRLLGFD